MGKLQALLSFVILFLAIFTDLSSCDNCRIEWFPPGDYFYLDDAMNTSTPFFSGKAINVALASTPNTRFTLSRDEADNIDLYITEEFLNFVDIWRPQSDPSNNLANVDIHLRCRDGTFSSLYNPYVLRDQNTNAPLFSDHDYILRVTQPWPIEIPINLANLLLIRDNDYKLINANIALNINSDVLTFALVPLFSPSEPFSVYPYDYRVDLFIKAGTSAGIYEIPMEASDGVYVTTTTLTLEVIESDCLYQTKDPIFGKKGSRVGKLAYYNATLNTIPGNGNALPGVIIEAHTDDENCKVEIKLNTDKLKVIDSGEVVFATSLSAEEVRSLGSTWIVDVEAIEVTSGRIEKVPLIISINFGK